MRIIFKVSTSFSGYVVCRNRGISASEKQYCILAAVGMATHELNLILKIGLSFI